MTRKKLEPEGMKAIGPYSVALVTDNWVVISGQIPDDTEAPIEEQTRSVLDKIKRILEEAGLGTDDVIRCEVYMTDLSEFGKMNEIYAEYFAEPYPCRVTVGAAALPKGAKIEISVLAARK